MVEIYIVLVERVAALAKVTPHIPCAAPEIFGASYWLQVVWVNARSIAAEMI